MVLRSKVRVKRGDERVELGWKLWMSEKAMLVWVRLMQEMIKVGEIVGTVRTGVEGCSVALCFDLGFST